MSAKREDKETPLLKEEALFPEEKVLSDAMLDVYPVFRKLMSAVVSQKYGLTPQWNYYTDGKAWLCKLVHKKKTIAWLSVWRGHFRLSFYFTEKHGPAISQLGVNKKLKEQFASGQPAGKLKSIVIRVRDERQFRDVFTLIEFKKSLK